MRYQYIRRKDRSNSNSNIVPINRILITQTPTELPISPTSSNGASISVNRATRKYRATICKSPGTPPAMLNRENDATHPVADRSTACSSSQQLPDYAKSQTLRSAFHVIARRGWNARKLCEYPRRIAARREAKSVLRH